MIQTQKIRYSNADTHFEGTIAWDTQIQGKRPIVLLAHAYFGHSEFDINKAIALAKEGYLGFAIDMYGEDKRATTVEEAKQFMGELNADRGLLLSRIQLALKTAKELDLANVNKVAAIGFCFGGKCVLDLARSGENIRGVASFHGVYDQPHLNHTKPVTASILVLHGWEDPLAVPQQTVALADELTALNADWQLHAYGHTGHSFTNPNANAPESGMFFQQKSNHRAWKSMLNFLEEVFE